MLGKRKKNANLSGRLNFNNTILFCGNKNKKLTSHSLFLQIQSISYNTSKHVGPAVGVLKSLSFCVIIRHYVAFFDTCDR